jgi:DNA-binding MarR family transcriptional regulator
MIDNDDVQIGRFEPALGRYTGYLIRQAFVRGFTLAGSAMPPGRHPRDLGILATVAERGPLTQAALGRVLHVNRTIMVKVVDVLERDGLLRRERDPGDRRRYALKITDAGRTTIAAMREASVEINRRFTAPLTPDEHERLNVLLQSLIPDVVAEVPDWFAGNSVFLVVRVHHRLHERANYDLRELSIEPRHFGTLRVLDANEPCSQARLAICLGVTASAVVQTIDELDRAGLLVRERNPHDRREHLLRMTDRGRDHLARARRVMDHLQQETSDTLGEGAVAELNALLIKLVTETKH